MTIYEFTVTDTHDSGMYAILETASNVMGQESTFRWEMGDYSWPKYWELQHVSTEKLEAGVVRYHFRVVGDSVE